MGDARTKRREQLKRWAGSSTDRASDVPRLRLRLRRRGDAGNGEGEPEAELDDPPKDQPLSGGGDERRRSGNISCQTG